MVHVLWLYTNPPQDVDEADQLFEAAAEEGNTKWGKILKLLACIERDAKVVESVERENSLYRWNLYRSLDAW